MTLANLPAPNFTGADLSVRLNASLGEARAARRFPAVADLLADTSLAYGSGARPVTSGDRIAVAGGLIYEVAASGASNHHAATAGGVKLRVLPALGAIHSASAYGVVANDGTDQSLRLQAAIDALPARGGTLLLPEGLVKANVTIARSSVTLMGTGLTNWRSATGAAVLQGLAPFDNTKPALTIGNDTGYVTGTRLQNLSIVSEDGQGHVGLRLAGGTYGFSADGLYINGFRKHSLWIENGSFPACYIQVSNYTFTLGRGVAMLPDAANILCRYAENAGGMNGGFTTAVYLAQGNINFRTAGAWAIHLDGVELRMLNTWVEATQGHGLLMSRSWSAVSYPKLIGAGVNFDGDTGVDTVLKVPTTDLFTASWVQGDVRFDGLMENSAGTKLALAGTHFSLSPQQYNPRILGSATFPDFAVDPADVSARIYGWGTSGARRLNLQANRITLSGGAEGVYLAHDNISVAQVVSGVLRPANDYSQSLGSASASRRWAAIYSRDIRPGDGAAIWTNGIGSPEGSKTAPVGSLYTRTDGGAGSTLYVKESGIGNTGWVAK